MSDYIIGDVQGCYDALTSLIKKINFKADKDRLFFLGDVVNRGNKSLQTLRLIKDLGENAKMILGNHDFHLLACALTDKKANKKDTFGDILSANDKFPLIDFLLQQPLSLVHQGAVLVHAGVPPSWGIELLSQQSLAVQKRLQSENAGQFITNMYHDQPRTWSPELIEDDACRYTVNALLRMRFCSENDTLEFAHKLNYDTAPKGFKAWFLHENRALKKTDIFFGHWSALSGVDKKHIYPLDSGCIWGGALSAFMVDQKRLFKVHC